MYITLKEYRRKNKNKKKDIQVFFNVTINMKID